MILNLHQIQCNFSHGRKLVQIRYHKGTDTKMHKCLVGKLPGPAMKTYR